MEWLFGILLTVVTLAWLLRERKLRRRFAALEKMLSEIAHGREPIPEQLAGEFARMGQYAQQAGSEFFHLRRQRQLAEANLHIILSSMAEAVLVVDSRRSMRLVNPSARKMFDLAGEVLGEPVLTALREPALDDMIAVAMSSGKPQERNLELPSRKPPLTLAARVTPMRDAAGEPGALAMFRDVTRLTQLEKVRSEFVANVSHELRTPLAIFQGYVENLVDNPGMEAEQQAEVFAILQKHSTRLNLLVEDLLILARLEARTDELDLQPFDVERFCAEVARDWAVRMKKKDVTLKLDIQPDLPALSADTMRMEQVLSNLLDNALKYTPNGNTITLGATRQDGGVEIWVKDTGQGILSTDVPHIFERFYRADKARSRELGGTGLGLSIVKHIAQAHQGSVAAESVYGKGTTVRVFLPFPAETESSGTA
jgi:two-component system phosphate regulon sensor histidine kinase PhoR